MAWRSSSPTPSSTLGSRRSRGSFAGLSRSARCDSRSTTRRSTRCTSRNPASSSRRTRRWSEVRVRTGVEGFDPIVGGGVPEGASVVVQGPSGSEKEMFGLQFLAEGLRSGEAVVIVISSTSPEQYLESLSRLRVPVKEAIEGNRLKVVDWHSYQEENVAGVEERGHVYRCSVDLTNVGIAISRALGKLAVGVPRRAVLEILSPGLQVFDFSKSTKAKLSRHKVTALFLLEKEMHDAATVSSVSQPFDGVIDIDRHREGDAIE